MSTDKQGKATKARLHEQRWDFSGVEDWELVAATYYEYARESHTIQGCFVFLTRDQTDNPHQEDIAAACKDWPYIARLNACLNLKIEMAKLSVDLAALANLGSGLSEPWPKRKDKDKLRKMCDEFAAKSLAGAFRKIPEKELLQMTGESLWDWAELDAVFDSTTGALVEGTGVERMLVEINWKDFTDRELRNAFDLWLKSRPRRIPEPSKRGHDPLDCRARLFRLGLLRLRHNHTVEDTIQILCKTFPAKSFLTRDNKQKRPTKYSEPGELNREAEKAVDDFHALFPFLDPAERPLSWPMK